MARTEHKRTARIEASHLIRLSVEEQRRFAECLLSPPKKVVAGLVACQESACQADPEPVAMDGYRIEALGSSATGDETS